MFAPEVAGSHRHVGFDQGVDEKKKGALAMWLPWTSEGAAAAKALQQYGHLPLLHTPQMPHPCLRGPPGEVVAEVVVDIILHSLKECTGHEETRQ